MWRHVEERSVSLTRPTNGSMARADYPELREDWSSDS